MSAYAQSVLAEVLVKVPDTPELPRLEELHALRDHWLSIAATCVAWVVAIDRSQGRDFDRFDRLYTATEVGDGAAHEAELVAEPLRLKVKSLESQLDQANAAIRHLTRETR